MFIYPVCNHNWRNINTFYIHKTRLTSNKIFSPSNKIHREVGRAKDLSAPWYFSTQITLMVTSILTNWLTHSLTNWLTNQHTKEPTNQLTSCLSPCEANRSTVKPVFYGTPVFVATFTRLQIHRGLSNFETHEGVAVFSHPARFNTAYIEVIFFCFIIT
jgi:hypothetical protein